MGSARSATSGSATAVRNIAGATGTTYTLGNADVGHTIDVVASYTDGHGTAESVASAATAAVDQRQRRADRVGDDQRHGDGGPGADGVEHAGGCRRARRDQLPVAARRRRRRRRDRHDLHAGRCRCRRTPSTWWRATPTAMARGERDQRGDGGGGQRQRCADRNGDDQRDRDRGPGADGVEHAGGCRRARRDQLPVAARRRSTSPGRPAPPTRWAMPMSATPSMWWRATPTAMARPESVASAATAAVTNVNDAPTGTVTISGTAPENQVLTASNTLADADGLGAISYQWQRDGGRHRRGHRHHLHAGQCRCRPHHRRGGELHRRPRHGRRAWPVRRRRRLPTSTMRRPAR